MNLDVIDFAYGFGGGLLIGLSAAILLLVNGRIAGISGIFGGLLSSAGETRERAAFVVGLIGAPALWAMFGAAPEINAPLSAPLLIVAGLLVGFGTRMGGGCTSGHGVCGMTRASPRSVAAVVVFMAVGAAVVSVGRHVTGGL